MQNLTDTRQIFEDSPFWKLQRLLDERKFMEFTRAIQPMVENLNTPSRDLYLVCLRDAMDLIEPGTPVWEAQALERLAVAQLPELQDDAPAVYYAEPRAKPITAPDRSNPIQLRRAVQLTTYECANFESSDRIGLRRTVYRSPQERTFHRAVQLRYPGMLALPNYPLASVVNANMLRLMTPRRAYAYAMRSVLDVLLVTPGEGDPVVAFELDSAYHDTEEAKARDKLKNDLMRIVSIPFIRLKAEDSTTATVDDWYAVLSDQVGELPMPARHRCREQTLSLVPG